MMEENSMALPTTRWSGNPNDPNAPEETRPDGCTCRREDEEGHVFFDEHDDTDDKCPLNLNLCRLCDEPDGLPEVLEAPLQEIASTLQVCEKCATVAVSDIIKGYDEALLIAKIAVRKLITIATITAQVEDVTDTYRTRGKTNALAMGALTEIATKCHYNKSIIPDNMPLFKEGRV